MNTTNGGFELGKSMTNEDFIEKSTTKCGFSGKNTEIFFGVLGPRVNKVDVESICGKPMGALDLCLPPNARLSWMFMDSDQDSQSFSGSFFVIFVACHRYGTPTCDL